MMSRQKYTQSTLQPLDTAQPYYNFTVDNLHPKQQTLSRFQRFAQVVLVITNKSNRPAIFYLSGQGQTTGCHIEFEYPAQSACWAPQAELMLAPDETVSVPVRVMLPAPPLVGFRRQYYFTVTTTLLATQRVSKTLLARVTVPPLIAPWLLLLLGLYLAGLVRNLIQLPPSRLPPAVQEATSAPKIPVMPAGEFVKPVFPAGNSPPDFPKAGEKKTAAKTYRQIFEEIGRQYNLDWRILAEIAYIESRFNPWAIGRNHEMGLMQISPETWNEWAPQLNVVVPYDPYSNVQVAAAYLVYLRNYCQAQGYPETYWMLIGYNWGPNNLSQLFQQQGNLKDVPEQPRQYALRIIQSGPNTPIRRKEQLETIVVSAVESIK